MANGCRTFFRVILGILTALFLVGILLKKMFILNLLTHINRQIIGLFMLGFGIGLKVDPNGVFNMIAKLSEEARNQMYALFGNATGGAAIFMIVLGCITTVISFIGFAGAVSGSICLLVTVSQLKLI